MSILVFGSANIDETYSVPHMVARGETLAATAVMRRSGGKGLNQAIACARAGAATSFAGAVGEDGGFLLDELAATGVDTSGVRVLTNERTGVAVIQNDAAGDNCILLYGGANQCITREHVDEVLASFGPGDLVVLQNEINMTGEVIEAAHARGLQVALNPSPMDESVFEMPLELVDYVLLNEVEAAQLLGLAAADAVENADWESVAAQLAQRFPDATVVLTLGGAGSMLIADGGVIVRQPARSSKVVDTTGAGDTFTGFLLASLMRGEEPVVAMELAAVAAGIAVSRPGAAPSIPTLAECMQLS